MSGTTDREAVATDDPATLDVGVLGELGLLDVGMAALLADLVDAFIDVTDGHLRELHSSVADGDVSGVRRLAHTIKGSGGQLGGRALAAACTRLEERVDADPQGSSADEAHELEVAYEALKRALQALVGTADPAAPTAGPPTGSAGGDGEPTESQPAAG